MLKDCNDVICEYCDEDDIKKSFDKASIPGTKRLSFERFVNALVYVSRIRYPKASI